MPCASPINVSETFHGIPVGRLCALCCICSEVQALAVQGPSGSASFAFSGAAVEINALSDLRRLARSARGTPQYQNDHNGCEDRECSSCLSFHFDAKDGGSHGGVGGKSASSFGSEQQHQQQCSGTLGLLWDGPTEEQVTSCLANARNENTGKDRASSAGRENPGNATSRLLLIGGFASPRLLLIGGFASPRVLDLLEAHGVIAVSGVSAASIERCAAATGAVPAHALSDLMRWPWPAVRWRVAQWSDDRDPTLTQVESSRIAREGSSPLTAAYLLVAGPDDLCSGAEVPREACQQGGRSPCRTGAKSKGSDDGDQGGKGEGDQGEGDQVGQGEHAPNVDDEAFCPCHHNECFKNNDAIINGRCRCDKHQDHVQGLPCPALQLAAHTPATSHVRRAHARHGVVLVCSPVPAVARAARDRIVELHARALAVANEQWAAVPDAAFQSVCTDVLQLVPETSLDSSCSWNEWVDLPSSKAAVV